MVDRKVLDAINAECVEQYERVRQSGVTDMYDRMGVTVAAEAEGFYALVGVAIDENAYRLLLMNFGSLMKHYGITQEARDDDV